jgi:uncharacterized protein (TIGR02391 family)
MLSIPADELVDLPVDELALRLVADLVTSSAWNEHSYLSEAAQLTPYGKSPGALQAISEAFGWARAHGLIAQKPADINPATFVIARAGHAAIEDSLVATRAAVRLSTGLHPQIEHRARRQFLLGEYEQSVFVAMKAVEVRVRELAGFGNETYGVDMMNKAFGPTGPLSDHAAARGEQDGMRALFGGAYGVLRNPSGHREVDYDDIGEAAEAVTAASLLMRILDRVERRLTAARP